MGPDVGHLALAGLSTMGHSTAAIGQEAALSAVQQICTVASAGNMRDNLNNTSDSYKYIQIRDALLSRQFENYEQYSQAIRNMNGNLEIWDAVLKFGSDAKQNSSTFQQRLNEYRTSNYSIEEASDSSNISRSLISSESTRMISNCTDVIKNIALQSKGLFVSGEPVDRELKTWSVRVSRRTGGAGPHIVTGLVPSDVSCSYGNSPVVINRTRLEEAEAVLECVKPNGRDLKNLTVSLSSTGAAEASARLVGIEDVLRTEAEARIAEVRARAAAAEQQAREVKALAESLAKSEARLAAAETRLAQHGDELRRKVSNITFIGRREPSGFVRNDVWSQCDTEKREVVIAIRHGRNPDIQASCMEMKLER